MSNTGRLQDLTVVPQIRVRDSGSVKCQKPRFSSKHPAFHYICNDEAVGDGEPAICLSGGDMLA